MNEHINVSEMVLMTGGDGEIVSGGFDVGSLLLKNQLTTSNDAAYKTLIGNSIPFGLLYDMRDSSVKEDILEGLTEGGGISNSQIIDDELYTKLLNDWSFTASSVDTQSKKKKKKKTIRQKGNKGHTNKTKNTKRNRH